MDKNISSLFSLTNHELYLVTSHAEGIDGAQIATWIMPATLAAGTPRIVAVISRFNFTHGLISQSKRFAVQLLASDQYDLVPHFGLYSGRDRNKFEGLNIERTPGGLPLIAGTCGWVECIIVDAMDSGDRMIYLANVLHQKVYTGKQPLRKAEAFLRISPDVRSALEEKARYDGERDMSVMKNFEL